MEGGETERLKYDLIRVKHKELMFHSLFSDGPIWEKFYIADENVHSACSCKSRLHETKKCGWLPGHCYGVAKMLI